MAVGARDYFQYVKPSRTILAYGQGRYITGTSVVVAADGGYLELSISPETGYDLTISLIIVSCYGSCIQVFEFRKNDTLYHRGCFDIEEVIAFPEYAAYLIHSTEYFKVRIINNDSVERRVNITVLGTTERVA